MSKKVVETRRLMQPIAHFSHAVRVGSTIHVGAIAGVDETRRLAGATPGMLDVKAQCSKALDNLETVLALLQTDCRDLIRVRAFLSDPRDIAVFEQGFSERFPQLLDCLSVGVSYGFPLYQAAIELDAEAQAGVSGVGSAPGAAMAQARRYFVARPADDGGAGPGDGTEDQVERAFRDLFQQIEAKGFEKSDVVALEIALVEPTMARAVENTIRSAFAGRVPCCSVVVSPLGRLAVKLEIQALCVAGGGEAVEHPQAASVFSCAPPALLAGDELYISAQCGTTDHGLSVEAQTRKAWERILGLVEAAGLEPTDILRTTNVLTDWRHYAGFNQGYGASIGAPYPPRTTILGGLLTAGAHLQIQAVAHRNAAASTILNTP